MHSNFDKEISLDEERITYYFALLPYFLDLPGEESAIFECFPVPENENVRKHVNSGMLRYVVPSCEYDSKENENDDREYSDSSIFSPADCEMPAMLDNISVICAEHFALNEVPELKKDLLAILCQCSKTLNRISDLLCADNDPAEMQAALTRRAFNDVNDLMTMINNIAIREKEQILNTLQIIRENLLNIFMKLQKN